MRNSRAATRLTWRDVSCQETSSSNLPLPSLLSILTHISCAFFKSQFSQPLMLPLHSLNFHPSIIINPALDSKSCHSCLLRDPPGVLWEIIIYSWHHSQQTPNNPEAWSWGGHYALYFPCCLQVPAVQRGRLGAAGGDNIADCRHGLLAFL